MKETRKFNSYDLIAIISGIGIISWIISDFYGGMLLFVLVYWWVVIPILILYFISFITTSDSPQTHLIFLVY